MRTVRMSVLLASLVAGAAAGLVATAVGSFAQAPARAGVSFGVRLMGTPGPKLDTARTAASDGLARFSPAILTLGYKKYGFASADELRNATVGAPIRVASVSLPTLAAFSRGKSARSLIKSSDGLIVPVLVGGAARCAIFLKPAGWGYSAVGIGQPATTKLIVKALSDVAAANQVTTASLYLVKVPGLFLTFVARQNGPQTLLTLVSRKTAFAIPPAREFLAEDTLGKLTDAAKRARPSNLSGHHPK